VAFYDVAADPESYLEQTITVEARVDFPLPHPMFLSHPHCPDAILELLIDPDQPGARSLFASFRRGRV